VTGASDPLATFLDGEVRRGAMPGVAWWVGAGRGALSRGALGHATIEPGYVPLSIDTPFDLASLTKPLATALLATMLHSERRLDLDAELGSVFPELAASPFSGVTLRDAAAHRAGFPAWTPLYLAGSTRDAYIAAIASCDRLRAGETVYSDLGYVLLGFAVEQATGAPLDQLFIDRIARPLRLTRTAFPGTSELFRDAAATERRRYFEATLIGPTAPDVHPDARVLRGQVHDGNAWGLGGVAGHAGLFGPAEEVVAIALAILDPRLLGLNDDTLDPMLHPVANVDGARTIGFVLARDAESVRGILPDDAVGHLGFTGTSLWIDAAVPRIYVLLTNRVHPLVPHVPFTAVRRGFHEIARSL
jgi:CubicO group peptidase (beta-lactamase class C family)